MSILSTMTSLADAVREKTGLTYKMNLQTMAEKLQLLSSSQAHINTLIDRSIKSITIPNSTTSIRHHAFRNCFKLSSVTFEEGSKLEVIGNWAFAGCSSLTSITIPESVTLICANAFEGCTNLNTVYCKFSEGAVHGAPWGAPEGTKIVYVI